MTKFKGPLKVGTHGAPGTEVDYVTIDVSGTASFAGNMAITGSHTVTGNQIVSGAATFTGVMQQGAAGQRGTAVMVQRTTILANSSAGAPKTIKLPNGSDIVNMTVDVETPFQTAAGVTACNVEVSAAGGLAIAHFVVSASTTRYGLETANAAVFTGSALRNVTATIEAHVSVQASNSALSAGQGMLTVTYIPA